MILDDLLEPLDENVLTIEQMSGASETFRFRAASNGEATLLLSTLVGMRLPGRFATFTGFQIAFEKPVDTAGEYRMTGTVEKVTAATLGEPKPNLLERKLLIFKTVDFDRPKACTH
jgi:hypothetical protein